MLSSSEEVCRKFGRSSNGEAAPSNAPPVPDKKEGPPLLHSNSEADLLTVKWSLHRLDRFQRVPRNSVVLEIKTANYRECCGTAEKFVLSFFSRTLF